MKGISELTAILGTPRKIVITTHANPDADALGSSLGLKRFLRSFNHEVHVITPTDYPDFLTWMPGNDDVIIFGDRTKTKSIDLIGDAEIIFCLDFSGLNRIKKLEEPVRNSEAKKVLIDHHLDPEDFADFMSWDTTAAATAELVFDMIEEMGEIERIDAPIANCLYAGIMTDTGSFKHPSTTAKVHEIVARLISFGADINYVNRQIYDTNSIDRLRFTGFALLEKLVVRPRLRVAYFYITSEDRERFKLKTGDTEGLVNYALSIKGIVMAAIIICRNDEIRLSFRSVDDYAVNAFASDHFGGGGHKNAAGGSSNESMEVTIKKFEHLIKNFTEDYNRPA